MMRMTHQTESMITVSYTHLYHSLAADAATMPDCLKVTAVTDDGEIMAVQHTDYPIYGVQFHPESIMTPNGKTMLENFLKEN